MLVYTFPGVDVIYKRTVDRQDGGCNKKGYVEYTKIFIWEEVLINGDVGNGWQFFLRIGAVPTPPAIRLHRVHF